jgi:hypothetical protein
MRKYPTAAEVEEMRTRGFDPSVIAEQLELAKRGEILEALIVTTAEEFSGITLGSGIGLLEANGLDDYANEKTLASYREKDEKSNWQAIPLEALNRYSSSLSFFDAEGMRFHLPAFLTASMRGEYAFDLVYNLTQSTLLEDQCSLLTQGQRKVVRQYLQFAEGEESHEFDREHIQRALGTYWAK